ncbi:MAG TPA: DUF4160 domain-containing protein [Thermoanaerobaculia bacterium]|nr:DUF4160 domain-containing protein [Thermoanaerobaculia bacterium]
MPIISRFFGIIVTINYREHDPPHFHAWYSGQEGTINISDGAVRGALPRRVVALLLEWWHLHRDELAANWQRARAGQPLLPIDPLE